MNDTRKREYSLACRRINAALRALSLTEFNSTTYET